MEHSWNTCIDRARQLASRGDSAAGLLQFYADLLRVQKDVSEHLRAGKDRSLLGTLERDLAVLRPMLPRLLVVVQASGPVPLSTEAERLLVASDAETNALLFDYWHAPSDRQFFAKAFLQPYASSLAAMGIEPNDRGTDRAANRCPFCGGKPQLSILRGTSAGAEGGNRSLVCATCLTTWPFGRVICANCGEQDERKLGYYHSPAFDHLRIEACDACGHYLKGVDLLRLGLAVPLVDEVAGAPLDLWARDHGYVKIELNLVGL